MEKQLAQYGFESYSLILDSLNEGVFTVDQNWNITFFNRAAEQITGASRQEVLGRPCCEVFRANICEGCCALRQSVEKGEPQSAVTAYIVDSSGKQKSITISASQLKDKEGHVIGGVEVFTDLSEIEALRRKISRQFTFQDIISKNKRMQEIFETLPRIAESDCNVLIEGESGTGKELIARALHNLSNRKDKPFIAVNCSAFPDTLLESEFFGYKAGAFTDARKDKAGRFAMAEGGTLFLDEIGEISPALQVRLLRVIQQREYEPLGATGSIKADVRIVSATNRDLKERALQEHFRSDLYYRINVARLLLPPLQQRREDIPLLIDHFISRFNQRVGREVQSISPAALEILMRHPFPGNVRELENILEYAFVICDGSVILPQHLPEDIRGSLSLQHGEDQPATLLELEMQAIRNTLLRNQGNRQRTASELGIHTSTLFRKIKLHNIDVPETDGRNTRN